jgi:hypothetical protein
MPIISKKNQDCPKSPLPTSSHIPRSKGLGPWVSLLFLAPYLCLASNNQPAAQEEGKAPIPDSELTYLVRTYVTHKSGGAKNLHQHAPSRNGLIQTKPQNKKTDARQPTYTMVYGNPEHARVVLVMGTSLGCATCQRLYEEKVINALKKHAQKRNSGFAFILRDYPIYPISTKISAMLWACGQEAAEDLLLTLHNDSSLDAQINEDQMLDKVETLIGTQFPKALAAAKTARHNKASHEHVFNSRAEDKTQLSLTKVPWCFILEKKTTKDAPDQQQYEASDSWSFQEIDLEQYLEQGIDIMQHIGKLIGSNDSDPQLQG